MDLSLLLEPYLPYWPYLLAGAVLAALLNSAWFKGVFGEWLVNRMLHFKLDKNDYQLMKNVTLPTADGSTQIDHIVVSPFGVFVIETKNLKGWIFGSANRKQWTQKIYKNHFRFQNPLHQNHKHVKTLQTLLALDNEQILSVIAFVGSSTFKTSMPDNVTQGIGLIRYIQSFQQPVINAIQQRNIVHTIETGRLVRSLSTHREHVRQLQSRFEHSPVSTECPKCGHELVTRQIKRGKNAGETFVGCSQFPRCRYIQPKKQTKFRKAS